MIYEADQGLEYHIKVNEDMIGQYVIMPGDPKRCKAIAAYLESTDEYLRRFMDRKAEEKASRVATTATDPDVRAALDAWLEG